MSYNGAGIFQLVSGNPVVTGTLISSTWANNTLNDIANNGLSNCITKDGQQTVTANIPFSGFRATGLANGVNSQDAATVAQLQGNTAVQLATVAGTDTITATASPAPAAYAAGQRFQFVSAGANTTTAVTLNISGLGAKSITRRGGSALIVGEIATGQVVTVVYDGTQFQLQNVAAGTLIGVQVFNASGTYTPTPGMSRAIAEVQGAGAGSGGAPATGAGQFSGSPGASSGSYAKVLLTAAQVGASQTATIGAAGSAGGSGSTTGSNGGNTSLGALISCPGGVGSSSYGPTGATFLATSPSAFASLPTVSVGTILLQNRGNQGGAALGGLGVSVLPGAGASSPMQGSASSLGAGAGGTANGASASASTGNPGNGGLIIIWEYA